MTISNKFKEIITQANAARNPTAILRELERIKKQNFNTYISTAYSVEKLVLPQWKPLFKVSKSDLAIYKKEQPETKQIEIITLDTLKQLREIFDNPTQNLNSIILYLLLNTGRRISEVLQNPYIVKGNLYMILNKKADQEYAKIDFLLDQDIDKTKAMLDTLRAQTSNIDFKKLTNSFYRWVARFKFESGKSFSAHTLRGLYAKYLFKFRNLAKVAQSSFIDNVLNHGRVPMAAHYDYIKLKGIKSDLFALAATEPEPEAKQEPDEEPEAEPEPEPEVVEIGHGAYTVAELKQMCKNLKIPKYHKLNKHELINILKKYV